MLAMTTKATSTPAPIAFDGGRVHNDDSLWQKRLLAKNLCRESEAFLAWQMDEMQAPVEEHCKVGMLPDSDAPVFLSIALQGTG